LPAGEPHSYLEGTGVEIMANSNNVLRGGLTLKRVDVEELLSVLTFECGKPTVLELERDRRSGTRARYVTPALEFELSRVRLNSGESDVAGGTRGAELGIVLDGKLKIDSRDGSNLDLERGQSFLIPYGIPYVMSAREAATVFVGSVPS
jgi:mannose-6-phosphate isomerase